MSRGGKTAAAAAATAEANLRYSQLGQAGGAISGVTRLPQLWWWWWGGTTRLHRPSFADRSKEWIHYSHRLFGDWSMRAGSASRTPRAHFYLTQKCLSKQKKKRKGEKTRIESWANLFS